jgi:hypothetical protein
MSVDLRESLQGIMYRRTAVTPRQYASCTPQQPDAAKQCLPQSAWVLNQGVPAHTQLHRNLLPALLMPCRPPAASPSRRPRPCA